MPPGAALVLQALLCVAGASACGDDAGAGDTRLPEDTAGADIDTGATSDSAATEDGAVADVGPTEALVVTLSGPVQGVAGDGVLRFWGIPYAASPAGALRFRPPQPVASWRDPLDATAPRASCPQEDNPLLPIRGTQQEDCLELNVATPSLAPAAPLPVLVFIHGGGFVLGSGNTEIYDGGHLASLGNVVVTINYRLGLAGFLAHPALDSEGDGPSGMYGLLDQQAALRWVRDNIGRFGGDSASVTLFGESAGAFSVCYHYVMPGSRGLFARAISESGACVGQATGLGAPPDHASARARGEAYATALGCPGTDAAAAACLRALPPEALILHLQVPTVTADPAYRIIPIGPNVDGVVLPDTPEALIAAGNHAGVPYVIGTNRDEATLFTDDAAITDAASYEAWIRAVTGDHADDVLAVYPVGAFDSALAAVDAVFRDLAFVCPTRQLAASLTAAGVDVRVYQFAQTNAVGAGLGLGAFHGSELGYVFGNFTGALFPFPSEADQKVSTAMQGYWTRFAATGDPNGAGAFAWPLFGSDEQHVVLADPLTAGTALGRDRCDALKALIAP